MPKPMHGTILVSTAGQGVLRSNDDGATWNRIPLDQDLEFDAVVRALNSGQLAGYAGDVWYPQPPPPDHPWRTMPYEAMTPHVSGSTLSAQARYAAGTREILECWFDGRPIRPEYLIVDGGGLAGTGARSYTVAG